MTRKQRGRNAPASLPREIRVRTTTALRVTAEPADAWVVNGRVIRFLDPLLPDDTAAPPRRRFGLFGR